MKKEIDTWKLDKLFETFKSCLLWGWYLIGVILVIALWFVQIPETKLQSILFAIVFVFYSLLSKAIIKVEQVKQELQ